MAEKNPTARCADAGPDTAEKRDLTDEALVLDCVLTRWPIHLQETDLERELQLGDDRFQRRDRVERAIEQLHWAGLALRCEEVVIPTRAALQYHLLSDQTAVDL